MNRPIKKSEKAVKLTAELYRARDSMRLVLGDSYTREMQRYGAAVQECADQGGMSVISAAITMAGVASKQANGAVAVAILAAAVELLEPSEPEGTRT